MKILADANVAVLIDFENVGLDAIQYLLDQLSDVGRIIIKRAYGDWSVQRGKQEQLIEQGIEAVHQYRSNRSGKNSSDIRLTIEAIDLFHTSPIDTFVIVSSDSDFVPLVGKLRSSGKTVIGSGRREATSSTLIRSCDRYIFLDDVTKRRPPVVAQPARRRNAAAAFRPTDSDDTSSVSNSGETSLVMRAYEASMDDLGYVAGSKLYQTMRRIDPGFDYRVLGFRTFIQFLEASSEIEINRPQNGGDVQVATKQGRDQAGSPSPDPQEQPESNGQRGPQRRGRGQRQPLPIETSPVVEEQAVPPASVSEQVPPPAMIEEETAPVEPDEEERPVVVPTNGASYGSSGLNWEREVDAAWTRRQRNTISGRAAATDAAKALKVDKLSSSQFPSLDKLLGASKLLQLNWRREGNTIVKK
ncbi:MAG: hypothetical protein BZY79_05980 [SAR202 cluster bacterium Casp-Chloro-G4]|nr:MAG: hypothetical protein BZY79_05980 [SAR202 cluster bacterium Casp-Chloro-G4]